MKLAEFRENLLKVLTKKIQNVVTTPDAFDVGGVQIRPASYKDRDCVLWIFIEYRLEGKRYYKMIHVKEIGSFKHGELFTKVMDMLKDKITKEKRRQVDDATQTSTINGFSAKTINLKAKSGISIEIQTLPAPDGPTGIMFSSVAVMDRVLDLLATHGM